MKTLVSEPELMIKVGDIVKRRWFGDWLPSERVVATCNPKLNGYGSYVDKVALDSGLVADRWNFIFLSDIGWFLNYKPCPQ